LDKERLAIDYSQLVGKPPGGRPQKDISAFALMTTVYTDTITVPEVTGYGQRYLARDNRSIADWRYFVSERNKAIRNVELLGSASAEGQYRIQQALRIGPLITQYENPSRADFLPYASEEVDDLVNALLFEANNRDDQWVADEAFQLLTNATLLQQGYQHYTGKALKIVSTVINGQNHYELEP
jgi:hypothetical protein